MPTLIVLGGFAGAGKTTVARRLSSELRLPLFSSDEFIAGIMKANDSAFHEAAPSAYTVMWHIIERQHQNNISVILDANMCSQRTWDALDELAGRYRDLKVIPVILECPLHVHKERIEKRGKEDAEHLNLGGDVFEDIVFKYEYIQKLDRSDLVRIDASRSLEEVYADVLQTVRQ